MQSTGNIINNNLSQQARITIRASKNSLSFTVPDNDTPEQIVYEPYTVKSGVSIAANLRQALRESNLLAHPYKRARLLIDVPVLMVPIDEFDEKNAELFYQHAFGEDKSAVIMHRVQPSLSAVAIFPVNKDLRTVMEDAYRDVRYTPVCQPVWNHLQKRSFVGAARKLYAYFHDGKLDIFAFDKNRFKFFNSYSTTRAKDSIYFILYVWKMLGMNQTKDELLVVGDIPDKDWFLHNVRLYVQKAFTLNPAAEFNRAPLTAIKGLPFDIMAMYLRK